VFGVADAPTADVTGAVAGFADATGRFLPLVCTLNATQVTDAVGRLLDVDHDTFDRLALSAEPGAGGVTVVPYFAGERTPNRPDARGQVTGLRNDVTRAQMARATVEGVVCGLLDGLDALADAGVPTAHGRIVLVGGGARSAAYRQVVADLSGRAVHVAPDEEHVAAGACVQAAAILHGCNPADVSTTWGARGTSLVEPQHSVDHEAIRAAYAAARG
jgi:xylulokinase